VQAQPPLKVFAGQQSIYKWANECNASDWFKGYEAILEFSATTVYIIQSVTADSYLADVDIQGSIQWPTGCINRSVYLGTPVVIGGITSNWTNEELGDCNTFEFGYTVWVHETGSVQNLTGPCMVSAAYTFPSESDTIVGASLLLEEPGYRSSYFLDDVFADVGDIVGVFYWFGEVLSIDSITIPIGVRPALKIGFNQTSYAFDESWTQESSHTYYFDRETGFLLREQDTRKFTANEATITWISNGCLISTNMYFPRLEQIFLFIMLGIISCISIIIGLYVYLRVLRRREFR
jgi:hypothetical protein